MTFTTYAREQVAISLGSYVPNNFINYFCLGNGSMTELNSNTHLGSEIYRNVITGSADFSQSRKVTFTADVDSVTLSGLVITEFGFYAVSGVDTSGLWIRNQIVGSIVGTGNIELKIQDSVEVM